MSTMIEYGPAGPTAQKDITPPEGMSREMAAFIAANASPFTNPRDLPAPAKVPDVRNTQETETAFIYGKAQLVSHTDENGLNSIVIVSSPDPFSPIPLAWSKTAYQNNNLSNINSSGNADYVSSTAPGYETPASWARDYDRANLEDMIAQQRFIARRCRSYRVVGHGLKVWVAKNTSINNGNIEAGQLDIANMKNIAVDDFGARIFTAVQAYTNSTGGTSAITVDALAPIMKRWSGSPTSPADSYQATLIKSSASSMYRRLIAQGRTPDFGFLSAEEGATVRWTDDNDFKFQPAIDRGFIFPSKIYNPITECAGTWERSVVNSDGTQGAVSFQYMPNCNPILLGYNGSAAQHWGTQDNLLTSTGAVSGFNVDYTPVTRINSGMPTISTGGVPTYPAIDDTMRRYFYFPGQIEGANVMNQTNTLWSTYSTSPDAQFNKALYCDVSGIDASQVITVQVVWHIEYVPRGIESMNALQSPADKSYEDVALMLRDHRAFPVVVKGHSFFSSLRNAFSKAARFVGKIFTHAAAPVGGLLASSGDPRLMMAGTGLLAIDSALKRKRALREAAESVD